MTFKEKLIKNNVNVVVLFHELPVLEDGVCVTPFNIVESYPNFYDKFWEKFHSEINKFNHVGNNIIVYTDGMIFVNCINHVGFEVNYLCTEKANKEFRDTHKFLIPRINYYFERPTIFYDEI